MTRSTVQMKLHKNQDTGFCRITYLCKNDAGETLIYCLQDNNGIRLMRCSQDGEPMHEVTFKKVRAEFERPEPISELEKLVNNWIDGYEAGA